MLWVDLLYRERQKEQATTKTWMRALMMLFEHGAGRNLNAKQTEYLGVLFERQMAQVVETEYSLAGQMQALKRRIAELDKALEDAEVLDAMDELAEI